MIWGRIGLANQPARKGVRFVQKPWANAQRLISTNCEMWLRRPSVGRVARSGDRPQRQVGRVARSGDRPQRQVGRVARSGDRPQRQVGEWLGRETGHSGRSGEGLGREAGYSGRSGEGPGQETGHSGRSGEGPQRYWITAVADMLSAFATNDPSWESSSHATSVSYAVRGCRGSLFSCTGTKRSTAITDLAIGCFASLVSVVGTNRT